MIDPTPHFTETLGPTARRAPGWVAVRRTADPNTVMFAGASRLLPGQEFLSLGGEHPFLIGAPEDIVMVQGEILLRPASARTTEGWRGWTVAQVITDATSIEYHDTARAVDLDKLRTT